MVNVSPGNKKTARTKRAARAEQAHVISSHTPSDLKVRKPKSLAPQQARSRESLQRLQKATIEVMGQHGVDGATIPRIAAHAGLTPGAVYRRFSDKEALLESAILGILERQENGLRTGLTVEAAAQIPLSVFAGQVVNSLVVSYRSNASLLRAIRQFVQSTGNAEFLKKVSKLRLQAYKHIVDQILASAKNIKHPQPTVAVSLGLMMVIGALRELIVDAPDTRKWKGVLPGDDLVLKTELTRALLCYLGTDS